MNDLQLRSFLDSVNFLEWEKEEIINSTKKLDTYQKRIFFHELHETNLAFQKFHEYIQHNSIFLRKDIKKLFEKLDNIMWGAIVDKEIGHESKDWKMQKEAWDAINDNIKPLIDQIEELVQKRLRLEP